jgi:hypothetical protein
MITFEIDSRETIKIENCALSMNQREDGGISRKT